MNYILLATSFAVFTVYFLFIWIKYGVQKSLSISYYCLPEKNRKYIFTAFIFGFTLPLIPLSYDYQLMLIAIWLIMGVGATSQLQSKKWVRIVHMIVAIGGIVLSNVSIGVELGIWQIQLWVGFASICLAFLSKKPIWWIEVVAFYSIMLAFILKF